MRGHFKFPMNPSGTVASATGYVLCAYMGLSLISEYCGWLERPGCARANHMMSGVLETSNSDYKSLTRQRLVPAYRLSDRLQIGNTIIRLPGLSHDRSSIMILIYGMISESSLFSSTFYGNCTVVSLSYAQTISPSIY